MRLFVAVELSEETVRTAARISAALRRDVGSRLHATWVAPENMHLTVRFIGQVEDARARAVIDALVPPVAVPPFDVELGACGMFPPSGSPRVIWIGLTLGMLSLTAMHAEFERRLLALGFERETRPFSAHLTLARVKDAPRGAAGALRDAMQAMTPSAARSHITRATIFQSHLSSTGPHYEPMGHVPLIPRK